MRTLFRHFRPYWASSLTAPALIMSAAMAQDSGTGAAIADLQRQIKALQEQVDKLKAAHAAPPPPLDTTPGVPSDSNHDLLGQGFLKSKGLTLGFYGESKYRLPEAGSDSFDAHRFVLTPSYEIADWLIFNSELELEHGGVDESVARGSRFNGEIELEQFYVDVLISDYFNVRSLGIDLVPVGRINTTHEPTTFYSTERPELYREIIPSTWMEPSIGFFGKITDTLRWRAMVSSGLEDFSSSAAGAGVTAANGMRNARPRLRGADESKLAYTGRLQYTGIRGLDASTSVYHSTSEGLNGSNVPLTLLDIEALYRVKGTGLELRGDLAYWIIENSEALLANNNASPTDDIGDAMYGWYLEASYHLWPSAWREGRGARMDFVPFARFSQIVTQSRLSSGGRLGDGTANRDFITFGAAWFLSDHFVLKADYRINLDGTAASAGAASSQEYLQLGVGMFF